jgi:hypothetical protein
MLLDTSYASFWQPHPQLQQEEPALLCVAIFA